MKKKLNQLAVLIPVYKETLNQLEQFSIDYLTGRITGRKIFFVAPESLDKSYYQAKYPAVGFRTFEDRYFSSIVGYNHLLLNADFYRAFNKFDYILIHQTDALIFKDNLDYWMQRRFDYVGAPWPSGVEVSLNVGRFRSANGVTLKSYVGNGGFSLRSIKGSIAVLEECEDIKEYWIKSGSSEDLFFAFAGMISNNFRIPNQFVASRFSLELDPEKYYLLNSEEVPTGCHAWWKHDLDFWKKIIARLG